MLFQLTCVHLSTHSSCSCNLPKLQHFLNARSLHIPYFAFGCFGKCYRFGSSVQKHWQSELKSTEKKKKNRKRKNKNCVISFCSQMISFFCYFLASVTPGDRWSHKLHFVDGKRLIWPFFIVCFARIAFSCSEFTNWNLETEYGIKSEKPYLFVIPFSFLLSFFFWTHELYVCHTP